MRRLRVLLADDHQLMRSGVRLMLEREPDLTVVGEASDGREAVSLVKTLKPEVVVMDIGMPNLNGIEAARQMTHENPELAIVIVSMHSDESYVLRALKAGARGYLLKDSAEADLIKAVHAVGTGKSFFSPAVSKMLLDDYVRKLKRTGTEDPYDLLTPREREILQLIAEGKSNKDIANLFDLSVYTVESHRSNLMEKLHLRGLPELILYAVRRGIIA
jgi:two-component system, NarL family, response regulator NreC